MMLCDAVWRGVAWRGAAWRHANVFAHLVASKVREPRDRVLDEGGWLMEKVGLFLEVAGGWGGQGEGNAGRRRHDDEDVDDNHDDDGN